VPFSTARSFLKSLEEYSDRLPVWQGELYFERHRGTLTTHGRVKRGNRRCEEALAAVEMLYASMPLDKYPAEVLDRLWKILLLNQFHDILPGSSIRLVYERTHREHDGILAECSALIQAAGSDDKDALTCVNTLGRKYNDFTPLPA
jgi:alpha-mannosidase